MNPWIHAALAIRLRKCARDNGFDLEASTENDASEWFGFASTQAPLRLWLTAREDGQLVAAFSQTNVANALEDHGTPTAAKLPPGATAARAVHDIPSLHLMARRAFQLSRTLPDELLHTFETKTANLPQTTETEQLIVRRVGQDIFRNGLLDYWQGRCAVTGLAEPRLLRASHIKAWSSCASDAERLDVYNGLLLIPNLDAAFDLGFITVDEEGRVVVSPALRERDERALGLDRSWRLRSISDGHRLYLRWHREHAFRDSRSRKSGSSETSESGSSE